MNRTTSLRSTEGFTMAIVLGVLMVASLLGLAAYAAANGDIKVSAESRDRKNAYAAAEAGINFYAAHLASDNGYWAKCTAVPAVAAGVAAPVTQQWTGAGTMPGPGGTPALPWRQLPGTSARYIVELLPAPGSTACNPAQPEKSMIDPSSRTFRIRATGWYRGEKRSIVATFRRRAFLDFLYFTQYETSDPMAYRSEDIATATTRCGDKIRADRSDWCSEIRFVDFDKVNGPLHTEDDLLVCGQPTFGRNSQDAIEVVGAAPGWQQDGGCSGTPNFQGSFKAAQQSMNLPPKNDSLATTALAPYTFSGKTSILLRADGKMDVTTGAAQTTSTMDWPANGLIYVKSGTCASSTPPRSQDYNEDVGCANVSVRGTYGRDLTIASEKDIVVTGNVLRASGSDALLGLIANNFVRVYHPVTNPGCTTFLGDNSLGNALDNLEIDAAILSLQHSFTVDDYPCGDAMANLTVKGAIAQKYRGAVGSSYSSGALTGYKKDYWYDDRFRYRSPPYFLDPVSASWRILRQNEQVPAR
jgi:hypothetical protein